MKILIYILFFLFFSFNLHAHTFTGMVGFYDGLSHPVLGMDHFLAMVSVGIVSAQIGGRAIWTVPSTFVSIMLIGGILGVAAEINKGLNSNIISLNELNSIYYFADYISIIIEFGIILSVILLGFAIAVEKKISVTVTMIFVGIFGLCHGIAHGFEMPWASNPILFFLGFLTGTTTLHIFGVGIGFFSNKTKYSSLILRVGGICCVIYGSYLLFI